MSTGASLDSPERLPLGIHYPLPPASHFLFSLSPASQRHKKASAEAGESAGAAIMCCTILGNKLMRSHRKTCEAYLKVDFYCREIFTCETT